MASKFLKQMMRGDDKTTDYLGKFMIFMIIGSHCEVEIVLIALQG